MAAGVEGGAEGLYAPLVGAAEAREPAHPAVNFPCFGCGGAGGSVAAAVVAIVAMGGVVVVVRPHEELSDERLDEAGGLLGGDFGDAEETLDHGGLGGDPTQPAAWPDRFGKGVEAEDAAVRVEREVRRHERVEKGVPTAFAVGEVTELRKGEVVGSVGAGVLQCPVRVVFDD